MKRALLMSCVVVALGVSTEPSLAVRQTAVGPGIIPLSPTGSLNGVDMSVSGITGTLTVGVVGGPEDDIFSSNNPVAVGSVAVSTAASSQGNIVFNSSSTVFGAIGVTQPGGPFLLNLSAGNAGTAVNFLGPVFATTLNVTGTGDVNFESRSTNITATNFAADGSISLAPNTTVIGALTTTAGANTGTLSLGGESVLNGAVGGAVGLKNIAVVGGSSLVGVSASISGAVDAFTFSLGTNTLNVGGALTIANVGAGGVINTTLASPTVYGNIRPVGATNLGPTLAIDVTVPGTAVIPVGTIFDIVQTQAGTLQSGTDGSVLTVTVENPTNPLYTFSAVPPAGTIAGLVAIRVTGIPLQVPVAPPPGAPLPPVNPVAAAVVPAIISILPTLPPTSSLFPVVAAINALNTPSAVVNAVAQLAPSNPDLAAPLVTFEGSREFQNLYMSRLDEALCGDNGQPDRRNLTGNDDRADEDTSYCAENAPESGWWLKGFGYFGIQDARQAFEGYDSRILGAMIAYDTPIDDNTRVGLGVGYARNEITGKVFDTRTDFNTYQGTVYLDHEDGPWFVYGDVSAGLNDYTGMRHIVFPGVNLAANASYGGQDYSGIVTGGYRFLTTWFTLTPLASLQYTNVHLDSYMETGAGDAGLTVKSQSYNFLESSLGAEAAHAYVYRRATFVPEIHFKWFHELENPTLANTAAFNLAGSPFFTTPGMTTANDTFNVGGGLTLVSCACSGRTWAFEAVYDHFWRSDRYSANQWLLKFTGRF